MACVKYELPNGDSYLVAEGVAHRPPLGAKLVPGWVDWTCAGGTSQHEVDAMLEAQGIPWGSAIAWVTKRIGIKQCSSCKAREEILNSAKEIGWAETLKQVAATFKDDQ